MPDDVFDEVASGLSAIGVGEKIYLESHPEHGATVGGANWELVGRPSGSTATLSATSGTLVTLVPDVVGIYIVRLTPLDGSMQPTEAVDVRVYAGTWVGAGVFNSHGEPDSTIPHCGNSCCHSESDVPRLNVVDQWLGTAHADKLQRHLSGELGGEYDTSCLNCHTLGFKETATNGGFDDRAADLAFDLADIPALVQQAATDHVDKWNEIPAGMQSHASIQCESCHGPGSNHLGNITEADHGIAGADLSPNACAQCHDSLRPEGGGFYQWSTSTHPITAELSEGHVADSDTCRICHTGEGFVFGRVNGEPIPQLPTHEYSSVTCSTCHDPHGSPNEHQLRVVGNFTLPNGTVAEDPGTGGLCVRCHNSRIANPDTTASTSTRGAHYGTAGDMLAGSGGVTFGLAVVGNSAHTTIVDNTCVACHMADSPANEPGVGGHTYRIRDTRGTADPADDFVNAANACSSCHSELTANTVDREARGDYDGDGNREGIQTEVAGLLELLRTRILATYPGTSLASNGKINITSGGFAGLNADQKKTLYNYNFVWQDGSFGVHNTSYAIQLLQRSYFGAFGHTITDDFPNIDLRGPVQASTQVTPTPTPTPVPTVTPVPTPVPEYLATVELMSVSPREIAYDQTGTLDERASGLRNVGVGEKVYMKALKVDDSVTGYTWSIFSKPAGSTAALSDTAGEMVTFRPDRKGTYVIRLTPTTTARVIDVFDQRIYAADWSGAGVFDTHEDPDPVAPQCGTSFCHGGNNGNADLNVLDDWLKSNHSQKLQLHLRGERGAAYDVSCLPCHTVGFNDHIAAVNNGFDDIATTLAYPLQNIVDLAQDAAANHTDNFPQLPARLQDHASVQCESCHGAGSLHPANLSANDNGIDGATLDPKACAQCHDSAHADGSGLGQGFYQWSNSTHPVTADLSDGHVADSDTCRTCHTGEGFIAVRVDKSPIPQLPTEEYHGVTCAVCHDPHGNDNDHQLRLVGDFTLPNGATSYGVGTGGACWRCHNSRIAVPETTALTSTRGAHYGPQGDIFLGTGGAAFGLSFAPSSDHTVAVADSCVACHMADSPNVNNPVTGQPALVGGHTYKMRDDLGTANDQTDDIINAGNACATCHAGLNTYDYPAQGDYDGDGTVEGTQTEVEGLFALLRTGILANIPGTSLGSNGRISISSSAFPTLTDDQKRAVYNYNLVWSDGSRGVHNASYSIQLLQRSYFGVYRHSILQDFPNMYLRGPVQDVQDPSKEHWATY